MEIMYAASALSDHRSGLCPSRSPARAGQRRGASFCRGCPRIGQKEGLNQREGLSQRRERAERGQYAPPWRRINYALQTSLNTAAIVGPASGTPNQSLASSDD